MKKTICILSTIVFCTIIVSCNKNDNAPGGNTSLINKWNLIKGTFKDSITGETDNVDVTEGSYMRFDTNGICYSMVDDEPDAGDWHYIDNNKGVFIATISTFDYNNTEFKIETLTDHALVLRSKKYSRRRCNSYVIKIRVYNNYCAIR